ncbi:hypothetical protein [Lactobacillus delbrueckii]|uniref:hypothetical protein n=1 Tax=Lactobacillus delbrueckii TaxID=1584 RepID=UPI0023E3A168|nr:hypothetical protein [Lactobacillus delbrueckii]MDF4030464.1 hypothetical protein [Lactobacillus delbrueckii]
MKETVKIKFDNILLVIYSCIVVIGNFLFAYINTTLIGRAYQISIVLFFVLVMCLKKLTLEQWLITILGISSALICWKNGGPNYYLYFVILMIAGSTLNPKRILKYTALITFLSLATIFLLCKFGKIVDIVFYSHDTYRHAFGMLHPLNFAATSLMAIMSFSMAIFSNKKNWQYAVIIIIWILFLDQWCNARNDEIALLILAITFLFDLDKIPSIKKILSVVLIFADVMAVIAIFITKIVPYGTNIYDHINYSMSNRLYLQSILFNNYGLKLFGQNIPQLGLGGQTATNIRNYFYIDSSYTRLAFMGGIVLFVIAMYVVNRFVYKLLKLGLYRQAVVLLLLMFNAVAEDTYTSLGINTIIVVLLSSEQLLRSSFAVGADSTSKKLLLNLKPS